MFRIAFSYIYDREIDPSLGPPMWKQTNGVYFPSHKKIKYDHFPSSFDYPHKIPGPTFFINKSPKTPFNLPNSQCPEWLSAGVPSPVVRQRWFPPGPEASGTDSAVLLRSGG